MLDIEIAGNQLQRLGAQATAFGQAADYLDRRLSELVMRIYRELQQTDDITSLALEALTLELLIEAARRTRPVAEEPRWLRNAKELLHQRFAEPLSLGEIAAAVEVHPAHLARTFRRYLRHLRIKFARTRLSASADPISAIALAAGFYDQCHFSRAFNQHTGMTPAKYRTAFRLSSSGTKLQT